MRKKIKHIVLWTCCLVLAVFIVTTIGASFYMLDYYGDSDTFVPTEMVHRLYEAKPEPKQLWITTNTTHACSYQNHREEYIEHIRHFLSGNK